MKINIITTKYWALLLLLCLSTISYAKNEIKKESDNNKCPDINFHGIEIFQNQGKMDTVIGKVCFRYK